MGKEDIFDSLEPKTRKYAPPAERDTSATLITDSAAEKSLGVGLRIADPSPDMLRVSGAERSTESSMYKPGSYAKAGGYKDRGVHIHVNTHTHTHTNNNNHDNNRVHSEADGYSKSYFPAPVAKESFEKTVVADYSPKDSLITHVRVTLCPSSFNYYERFRRNALKSHSMKGSQCPHVPYFSYIPQYAQLSPAQARYYLWFRDCARAGKFLEADFSYVLLYIYEIINLPDLIPAEEALKQLLAIWLSYRERFLQLDKYMAEWVCDFCLINQLELPSELDGILPAVIIRASLKEFYVSAMMKRCGVSPADIAADPAALAKILIDTVSDYDYRSSKYATAYPKEFEQYVTAAIAYAVKRMTADKDLPIESSFKPSKLSREAFCGSLCSMNAKKRIDVEFTSFARSYPLRRQITSMVKYAENKVRGLLKLKSRLSCTDIEPRYKSYIDEYFAPVAASRAASEKAALMPEYEKQYDAPDMPFTADVAAEIERSSWDVTSRLVEDIDGYDLPPADFGVESDEADAPALDEEQSGFETDSSALSCELAEALSAAKDGNFSLFCREKKLFADDVAGRINDFAAENLGDIVLEHDGTDYRVIEDYLGDIEEWINK